MLEAGHLKSDANNISYGTPHRPNSFATRYTSRRSTSRPPTISKHRANLVPTRERLPRWGNGLAWPRVSSSARLRSAERPKTDNMGLL